jgi:hypothetical protein
MKEKKKNPSYIYFATYLNHVYKSGILKICFGKKCFLEILFIRIIIEFVIENSHSQKPMCWDVEEEGICTIYVWYIIILKWEEHEYDFFDLEM